MAKKIRSGMMPTKTKKEGESSVKKEVKRGRFTYCEVCGLSYLAENCPKCEDLKKHNERMLIIEKNGRKDG